MKSNYKELNSLLKFLQGDEGDSDPFWDELRKNLEPIEYEPYEPYQPYGPYEPLNTETSDEDRDKGLEPNENGDKFVGIKKAKEKWAQFPQYVDKAGNPYLKNTFFDYNNYSKYNDYTPPTFWEPSPSVVKPANKIKEPRERPKFLKSLPF